MRRIKLIICVFAALSLLSCEKFELSTQADTFFQVKVEETVLPVWVKGNTASHKFIVYINGGPGLTSLDIARADMLGWSSVLEKDFAVVYYDQRGCGNSQGNFESTFSHTKDKKSPFESTLTITQYVKDLDAIISVLKAKYNAPSIYLMGHSFGGLIGANYLLTDNLQDKIEGFIAVDGAFNFDYSLTWKYRRDFLQNIADEEISLGNHVKHWNAALDWLGQNPIIESTEQKKQWRYYIGEPGGIILPEEQANLTLKDYLNIGFRSSYNPFPAYLSRNLKIVNDALNADAEGVNLTSAVKDLKLPTLFVWGRYDDLIPIEEAKVVFDSLGTQPMDKYFEPISKAGHEPFISAPDKFQLIISEFVKKY